MMDSSEWCKIRFFIALPETEEYTTNIYLVDMVVPVGQSSYQPGGVKAGREPCLKKNDATI